MTTNTNPYAMQDAFHAEAVAAAQHALDVCEYFDAHHPGWEQAVNPDRFVSEDDYNAATPQEWADLQTVLDWETFEGMGS